ncbi:MAG: biopolymer transporter ExbD [Phycisphaerae bacterium]|nr:biopolymer transporter ExbD [Phycisphaerae bacterium]
MRLGQNDAHVESFDLTPMIDVVLLLIIFFMLSSRFADATLTATDLPAEKGEVAPENLSKVTFDLDKDGNLFVAAKPATLADVAALVKPLRDATTKEGSLVVIRADRRCLARHLNQLAAELSANGIRDWAFTTQPEPSGATR